MRQVIRPHDHHHTTTPPSPPSHHHNTTHNTTQPSRLVFHLSPLPSSRPCVPICFFTCYSSSPSNLIFHIPLPPFSSLQSIQCDLALFPPAPLPPLIPPCTASTLKFPLSPPMALPIYVLQFPPVVLSIQPFTFHTSSYSTVIFHIAVQRPMNPTHLLFHSSA